MLNAKNLSPWPFYEPDEVEATQIVLQSGKVNYWTGSLGKGFEKAYASYVGKQYGIAVSSGTVALELALRAFNIGAGDEVIVASRSYVASASCVLVVGATPIFADVDIDSGNVSAEKIAPLITHRTKAIIPVHIGGLPCAMSEIMALAESHNLVVIEDCAQAHGAEINNKPVGAWGHAAIFSFCQDKIISTGGEGGMLLLDDETCYKTAWAYKDIGRDYDAVFNQEHPPGFRWYTHSAGSNFRMTELQAVIGLKQLEKLNGWIKRRQYIASKINKVLSTFHFIETEKIPPSVNSHAYYRLYAKVKLNATVNGMSNKSLRDYIITSLVKNDVPCFSGSCSEVYLEKAFEHLGTIQRRPNAKIYAENALCFLTHHTITDNELEKVLRIIKETLSQLNNKIKHE